MRLAIILSTYNGENYLRAQLNSILAQTLPCDCLLVRDDGSNDATVNILNEFATENPNIQILQDEPGHIGIHKSYTLLLQTVTSYDPQYIMFADQDDVWLKEKTAKLVNLMEKSEENEPTLVFSDAKIVSSKLELIAPSFTLFQKLDSKHANSLSFLLFVSPALGCTMLFNRALLRLFSSLSDTHPNPDKWLLLMAASFGRVKFLNESTILYRQHALNLTGGGSQGIKRKLFAIKNIQFLKKRYQSAIDEARVFKKDFLNLPSKKKKIIDEFIQLFTAPTFIRSRLYFKYCLTPPGWKRKLGLFLSLFLSYQ